MNSAQKQLILDNRYDPKVKDILNNPTVKSQIITPTIEKFIILLHLDEREQYKLIAFSDEVLQHVLSQVEPVVTGKVAVRPITNRLQWILRLADAYCKENNIKPDWKWYYDLCEIIGISTHIEPKPLKLNLQRKSLFDPLTRLKCELKAREERFAIYGGSLYDKKVMANLKKEIEELQKGEENNNAKQKLLYQSNSSGMASCSA